jgi:hypothetical protein
MKSIRDYTGQIFLCGGCGQPCYEGPAEGYDGVLQHFSEQWDGVHCNMFPLAEEPNTMEWDPITLATLQEQYPDTHPNRIRAA